MNIPPRGLWSMRQLCFNSFSMNYEWEGIVTCIFQRIIYPL